MNSRTTMIGLLSALSLFKSPKAPAQIITLADGNAVATLAPASSSGLQYLSLVGYNVIKQQGFWYGIGNGAEAPISSISAPAITLYSVRQASFTYSNAQLTVRLDYTLSGGTGFNFSADISEAITIVNNTGTDLPFRFFDYSDLDLAGGYDSAQMGRSVFGGFNSVEQWSGAWIYSESAVTPSASHAEIATSSSILQKLNDNLPTTLNDNAAAYNYPVGPGDVSWALQWDGILYPRSSALLSEDKYLQTNVPEPDPAGLVAAGAILAISRLGKARPEAARHVSVKAPRQGYR